MEKAMPYLNWMFPLDEERPADRLVKKVMQAFASVRIPIAGEVITPRDKEATQVVFLHYDFGRDVSHAEQEYCDGLIDLCARQLKMEVEPALWRLSRFVK